MSWPLLRTLRYFSTSGGALRRPALSAEYKSSKLWNERYNCKLLGSDENIIRSINSKIISGSDLNNLEVDIFINVAAPRTDETDQLKESVRILNRFRRSLYAHTILPSTPHAICRLFLDSHRLSSLLTLLENREDYGIFPDFFALNLLLDEALEKEDYATASRLASLVMLQEEFGINQITDKLALFALSKYIESKTDFSDWTNSAALNDPIFEKADSEDNAPKDEPKKEETADEDEEDEEDAEYIRIPFLINPYFDNHFDVKNPRVICGKSLSMLGNTLLRQSSGDEETGTRCKVIGSILQGRWSEADGILKKCIESSMKLGPINDLAKHYIENLHELNEITGEVKSSLVGSLDLVSGDGRHLSEIAELKNETNITELEGRDIEQFRASLSEWAELRQGTKRAQEDKAAREKLIEEVKAKKEELKRQEQYLYFFDNLKKSRLTRIEYN